MENYIVINGKRAELTKEQLKALGIEEKSNVFAVNEHEPYYTIGSDGVVYERGYYTGSDYREAMVKVGNYCHDKTLMKQRALHETLDRLLWRFACKNNDEIDWKDESNSKYYIYYNHSHSYLGLRVSFETYYQSLNVVYFSSREIAERAIDEIVKPFMKKHPDFVW